MKNLSIHQDKLCDAFSFAEKLAKQTGGKIATLPDLISLRAKTGLEDFIWERWITPLITLYFGVYNGKKLIVVAHHLGPLNTVERIEEWGNSGTNDEGSDRRAYGQKGLPKITSDEFKRLVKGEYGRVSIIDFEKYLWKFSYTFSGYPIRRKHSLINPLLKALFGKDFKSFIKKHYEISSKRALEEKKDSGAKERILELKIKDVYGWDLFSETKPGFPGNFPEEGAIAFFLTLGRPSFWGNSDLSISTDIHTHDDLSQARFIVLNDPEEDFVELDYLPGEHYEKCLVPSYEVLPSDCCLTLMHKKENLFVEYSKEGARMDTGEIKFKVTKSEKIGDETFFETPTYGSPFLKYGIEEVRAIMPPSANAYEITDGVDPGEIVQVPVQFYKVEVDTSHRILRKEEVMSNLSLLLEINGVSLPVN